VSVHRRPPFFVVVAGTDTGVGKTFVTRALARRLADEGVRVVAIKPIETGMLELAEDEEDGVLLAQATRQSFPRRALHRFDAPIAAPAAAELEGVTIDWNELVDEVRRIGSDGELVVVEGAGGLLSPLTWDHTVRDLATELGAPLLLVAPDRLGALNQVRMAAEAVVRAGVDLLGVVLSGARQGDLAAARNANDLRRVEPGLRLERLPEVGSVDEAAQRLGVVGRWLEEALEAGATGSRAR
jgi:dethiobiotin synthetase